MKTWRFIDSGPSSGAKNMAIDEKLLRDAAAGVSGPVLRFYTWDPPAVSLGRFQKQGSSVHVDECKRLGIDIVRRVTGGRAVFHHRELTYSIISSVADPLFPNEVLGTYRVIACGLLAGLRELGIGAEMVSRTGRCSDRIRKNSRDASCFSSPSWYEIVVRGKKIIGSAQRRVPGAFLQHGSILLSYDPALESVVIPGGGAGDSVTSIEGIIGGPVALEQVKHAFLNGFSEGIGIHCSYKSI